MKENHTAQLAETWVFAASTRGRCGGAITSSANTRKKISRISSSAPKSAKRQAKAYQVSSPHLRCAIRFPRRPPIRTFPEPEPCPSTPKTRRNSTSASPRDTTRTTSPSSLWCLPLIMRFPRITIHIHRRRMRWTSRRNAKHTSTMFRHGETRQHQPLALTSHLLALRNFRH